MPKKTFAPEQIVPKLRQIEVLIGQGKAVPGRPKALAVSPQHRRIRREVRANDECARPRFSGNLVFRDRVVYSEFFGQASRSVFRKLAPEFKRLNRGGKIRRGSRGTPSRSPPYTAADRSVNKTRPGSRSRRRVRLVLEPRSNRGKC
jgi:hypothetical protein